MSTISQSNKEDNIKIVSIGTLELTLHLTLTKSQASQYKVNIKDYNTAKDLSQLFESDNDNSISSANQEINPPIIDLITLSSDNFLINTLLYINRAFKTKTFIEFITYNEICFSDELSFVPQILKEVTQNNFFYIIQYRLKDIPAKLNFEIKIIDDDTEEVINKKIFNLFEKNYEVDNHMTKSESYSFIILNFDFSHDYFIADFSELTKLKRNQYEEISLFYILLISKFPQIKVISYLSINGLSLDLTLTETIKEVINNSDIIVFDNEEMKKFYSIYFDSNGIKWDKKEPPILFDKDKKRKNIQRTTLVIHAMKKIQILVQEGNNMIIKEKSEYPISSFVKEAIVESEEESQNSSKTLEENFDFFKAIFLGGFLSRLIYGKTYNTCSTAGNLLIRKMIDVVKLNIDNITNLSFYQVVVPKLKSKIEEIKKYNRKLKQKEEKFILDCINQTSSQKKDYNPLFDKYCQSFFASKSTRNHLHQLGFINKKGIILKDPGFNHTLRDVNYSKGRNPRNITIYSTK